MALAPAVVHTKEHFRPVLRLRTAGTGVEGQQGVFAVKLAAEQGGQGHIFHARFNILNRGGAVVQQGQIALLVRQFNHHQRVLIVAFQALIAGDLGL